MTGVIRVPLRSAAIALVVTGVGFAATASHPSILGDRVTAEVVLATGEWRFIHYAALVASVAGVFGVAAIVAAHGDRFGRLGDLALAGAVIGLFVTAGVMLVEAVFFPDIARRAPEVIQFDGQILGSPVLRVFGSAAGLFPLALVALGLLAYRDGTHRAAGAALAGATLAYFAFGFWFVPFVGPASAVLWGAAIAWWGVIVWRAATTPA